MEMSYETLYPILYLEINLLSIAVLAIIRVKTMGLTRMIAQRNFSMAVDSMVLFFASDTIWVLTENGFLPYSKWVVLISKDFYFFATAAMCYFWFVFFEYLQDSPFVKNKRRMWMSSVFVWIQMILIILNFFTKILYYVDGSNQYHRGPLFVLLYIFSYIYILFTCVRAFVNIFNKKLAQKRKVYMWVAAFPIIPGIGGILQFLFPRFPVVCGVLALEVLIIYLNWTDEMISLDPLTRLNNRKQLLHNYEQWIRTSDDHLPIYLLMIDANYFKSINDTYGHLEGDAALIRIADALRGACGNLKRRANIARYGGDEFVILVKAENDKIIRGLIDDVRARLTSLNTDAKAPYELTVSVGVAHNNGKKDISFKALAEMADEELYKEKEIIRGQQPGRA